MLLVELNTDNRTGGFRYKSKLHLAIIAVFYVKNWRLCAYLEEVIIKIKFSLYLYDKKETAFDVIWKE